MNALVVGVSADKPEAQRKFVEKYGLTFPMVPNPQKDIVASYGASMVLGLAARRITVLIDPQGNVARVWSKVDVRGHVDEVVTSIKRLVDADS